MDDISERTTDASEPASTLSVAQIGPEVSVVRRSGQGWRVGDDELPDRKSVV